MAPAISPVPAVDPCKVSVLAPAPVAVSALVNFKSPVPDWSIVAPNVVPARLSTRSVMAAAPVYTRVAAVVALPTSIVPTVASAGFPRLLAPALTLLIVLMLSTPAPIVVLPV